MANQPTKYRKFVVGAASAALVASAVAPVASAKDFSDTKGNTHEAAIDALSDAGIISGYQDGSFKPNQTLTRSDVVKLMGKWLVSEGYEVPSDYKTNPRFTDLTAASNDELLKYAAVVKDNGVFNGSNGRLLAGDNITRENMAVVLVRAFDSVKDINLVEYVSGQDFKQEVADRNSAKSEARPAIDVLDFFDITTVAQFNPKGTTTRGHFATFLHNFLNADLSKVTGVVAGVESITAVNNTTVEVKFVEKVEDLAALNFKIDGLEITNKVLKQTDAKTVVLTTAVQEGGKTYTVTANDNKLGTFNGVSAVVPTGISVTTPSLQGVIGKDVTVTATVTVPEGQSKAGVPVTFNVVNSSATNEKLEAVAYTDDKGVASYTYTRYYASEDNVAAYATHKSSVVSSGKVYWADKIQLAVSEITTGNDLANETKKSYKVTGKANATYYIAIKENLGVAPNKITDVYVQDHATKNFVTPYELTTGAQKFATVTTNASGEGSFTIYGTNLTATPIVYAPESTPTTPVSYNYNKLDLQAEAPTVKFSQLDSLAIAVVGEGTANSAEYFGTVAPVAYDAVSAGGRTYTVTVTDKAGKVAPEGTVAYVAFDDLAGDVYFSTGTSNFAKLNTNGTDIKTIKVGKDGKAQFRVAGKGATSYVTPTVFLNTAGDVTPVKLDKADVQSVADTTYFKSPVVTNAVLSVEDKDGNAVTSLSTAEDAYFVYQSVDQNGFAYRPTEQRTTSTQTVYRQEVRNGVTYFIPVSETNTEVIPTKYVLAFDVTSTFGNADVKDENGVPLKERQNLGRTKTYHVESDVNGQAVIRVNSNTADTVSVNVTGASGILPTQTASVSFTAYDGIPAKLDNAVVTAVELNRDRLKLRVDADTETAWINYGAAQFYKANGDVLTLVQFEDIISAGDVVNFQKGADGKHIFRVVTDNAPVTGATNPTFTDTDGDLGEIGGPINFTATAGHSYEVFLGTASLGTATVTGTAGTFTVAQNTAYTGQELKIVATVSGSGLTASTVVAVTDLDTATGAAAQLAAINSAASSQNWAGITVATLTGAGVTFKAGYTVTAADFAAIKTRLQNEIAVDADGKFNLTELQNIIDLELADEYAAVDTAAAVQAVNAIQGKEEVDAALRNPALGLNLTKYSALNTAQREDFVADFFPRGTAELPNFANAAGIQAWLDAEVPNAAVKEIVWAAGEGNWDQVKLNMFTAAGITGVTASNFDAVKAALEAVSSTLDDAASIQAVVNGAS
ncbi:S-layer homology domain-containing protein [Sporosarcina sp. 179-K 8C2 HS]|uniref:S-layer homology domain-containing protein n=1 Tax=Sporosarcina sp. 179-K 8C2 HS TaxID=3142387 RepID=UPI0039A00D1F